MIDLSASEFDLTFKNFERGPENEAAHKLAADFCELNDGPGYPYIIVGPSGEGKTHLLESVIHALAKPKPILLSDISFRRSNCLIPRAPKCVLVDDLSYFLHTEQEEALRLITQVHEALRVGRPVLMAYAETSKEQLLLHWPKAKIAEIRPASLDLKMRVAVKIGKTVPLKTLSEIAKQSNSLREVQGWIIRYDACRELGEPFNIYEGY